MSAPNILFIQVDQLTAGSLRCYGDKICHAPNLEKLAGNSWVFDAAYCNFPLCAPSRFSMATGQLCSAIGAYDNAAEMPASVPTYAHYLSSLGYQTALSGKMHFIGPDQYHGFETRLTPDLYPADFSWVPNWGDEGERDTNDARSILVSGQCQRSKQIDFDELVTFQAIQYLNDRAAATDNRPFFLQVSYTHPHEPYLCKPEYWNLYEGVDIPMPEIAALPAELHDAHSRRLLEDFDLLNKQFPDEDVLRARRAYYGSISYLDEKIGQIMEVLESVGMSQNTAIVFTSDHGEMLGERGMWFKKHFFEPSLRIPLLISVPGQAARRVATPASLVDLLPTLIGIATGNQAAPAPQTTAQQRLGEIEELEGEDLTVVALAADDPQRRIYAEYLAEATEAPIFMIRKGSYKYIVSDRDPALLFDLENDPLEKKNLAANADYASVVAEFQTEVEKKWDSKALTQQIILSQQRRRVIIESNKNSTPPRWNHDERQGEKVHWYRGEEGYNEWAFDYLPVTGEPVR